MASPILELMAKLGLDKSEYEKGLSDAEGDAEGFGSKLKGALGGAAKAGIAATGAAIAAGGAAVAGLASQAVSAFGQYEQLVGGVEKLYGEASGKIQEFANQAYATSGMSANQYMETATSFSASLINSLEGDVNKAADLTDVAMRAMSDNVNVFGSDMGSVQNAFQGFAKQNYTMLDNLKLGYGGTKEEMQRLIDDANEYRASMGQSSDLTIEKFSDVVQAIQSIQEAQGIAGTTGEEAMRTLEGSAVATKAAWQNVITAIGTGEGLSEAFNALTTSLFGEKEGEGLLNQIIPRIQQVMEGIGNFVAQASPFISEKLPILIDAVLPGLLTATTTLIQALVSALPGLMGILIDQVPTILNMVIASFLEMMPMIATLGVNLITTLASGIAENLPTLIPQIVDVVVQIVNTLLDNIDQLIDAGIKITLGLIEGIVNATPKLIAKMPEIIIKAVAAIISALPKVLDAGLQIVAQLIVGIDNSMDSVSNAGTKLIDTAKNAIVNAGKQAITWGRDLISNFIQGIKDKAAAMTEALRGVAQKVKDFLGFSEPKDGPLSNFHTYAPDMIDLFAKGLNDNKYKLENAVRDTADIMASGFGIKSVDGQAQKSYNTNKETPVFDKDLIINLKVGSNQFSRAVVRANQLNNYRSGGR